MGYAQAFSPCFQCGKTFAYNPHRVPSVKVEGNREPLCRNCVEEANPLRIKNGLPPIMINPDAYEPIHESEL
jgi:hypothetical protein